MIHRSKDTYPLSHFRQHTKQHLDRLREGFVETITQNGEAAMVVMSPETYDAMRITMERGPMWDQTLADIGNGKGRDAREFLHEVAKDRGIKL